MNSFQPLLESIGLNHHESTVYVLLLEHGEQPASQVARMTKIPRSTVRGTLDKLCERGIVGKVYKRNTQYYRCRDPRSLLQYVERHIKETQHTFGELEQAIPMLSAIHQKHRVVPKVRFFEGKDGVIEAFNHSLYAEGIEEILFLTSYRFLRDPAIQRNDDDFYIPLRVKKGIRLRVIVGRTERTDRFSRNDKKDLRQRRFLQDKYELPGNIHIYGDYVAYFSAGESEYMAVIVESKLMADTMRSLFECIWEHAA